MRASTSRISAFAAAVAMTLVGACAVDEEGDAHPVDELDFPVGVTADPSQRLVWVTSGNFDLAWRGGAVLAIDVATHRFVPELAFEVGSFPGPLRLLERDGRAVAGYILSRAEDALFHVTLEGEPSAPTVSCPGGRRGSAVDSILRCDPDLAIAARTAREGNDVADLSVGGDPVGALVRRGRAPSEPDLLLTGAMVNGNAATFTLDDAGAPTLVGNLDLLDGLYAFAEDPATGRVYTTSKSTNALQVLQVVRPDPDEAANVANPWLRLVGQVTVPESLAADRARGIATSSDGTRLYASYRSPNSLVVVDISADADGDTADRVIAKIPLGRAPGELVVAEGPYGDDLVYVACFSSDRIDVVDPARGVVVDSIRTARGPFGLTLVDSPELGVRRLYVANFHAHSVGVIELDPASPFYHTEVAEIR